MTAEIYLDAVHFQNTDGPWEDMDDTLYEENPEEENAFHEESAEETSAFREESADADSMSAASGEKQKDFVNKKGKLQIRLKKYAKEQGTVTIRKDGTALTWGISDAAKAAAVRDGDNGIIYPGVLDGMDVRCRVIGEKVKEDMILTEPQTSGTVTFVYQMKKLEAVQVKNHVSFVNEEGEEVFVVYAPYMKDAAGVSSEAVRVTLAQDKKNCCSITFHADEGWLDAPERRYPDCG